MPRAQLQILSDKARFLLQSQSVRFSLITVVVMIKYKSFIFLIKKTHFLITSEFNQHWTLLECYFKFKKCVPRLLGTSSPWFSSYLRPEIGNNPSWKSHTPIRLMLFLKLVAKGFTLFSPNLQLSKLASSFNLGNLNIEVLL